MENVRIAIMITCHNRREVTLACLEELNNQKLADYVSLQVYLVDAGSTDGTAEAVLSRFPDVNLIQRTEDLYWCGGMRVAFDEAVRNNYDYYLWLNDDTKLLPDSVWRLLKTACEIKEREGRDAIIVGSTRDPNTGNHSYGGLVQVNKWRPIKLFPVKPSDKPQQCDTMNGNCVLIPHAVAKLVGNISPEFTHAIGDMDYGLRAKSKGIPVWVASGYMGICARHPASLWTDPSVSLRNRLKIMKSPKGMPPHEWVIFTRRHTGLCWLLRWLMLYMRVLFPGFWNQRNR